MTVAHWLSTAAGVDRLSSRGWWNRRHCRAGNDGVDYMEHTHHWLTLAQLDFAFLFTGRVDTCRASPPRLSSFSSDYLSGPAQQRIASSLFINIYIYIYTCALSFYQIYISVYRHHQGLTDGMLYRVVGIAPIRRHHHHHGRVVFPLDWITELVR